MFMASKAEILIAGSAAGVGKSWALLMESLRGVNVPGYTGMIFRRTGPMITLPGGLWDESEKLYRNMGGVPRKHSTEWVFPSGARIKFNHLEHEKNMYDHQGAQYGFLGFDELGHFTERQFFYLLSRNRSKDYTPYCRATCNPDPDHWTADFIQWYIDPVTGFPLAERNGVVRYFTRWGGETVWGDSKAEVIAKVPELMEHAQGEVAAEDLVKSFAFIAGSIYDNKALLKENPQYLGNLMAQDDAEKARLLEGNWKASTNKLMLFSNDGLDGMFEVGENEDNIGKGYCSADVARFGSDWAVNISWDGLNVRKVNILTKCDLEQFVAVVEADRGSVRATRKHCIVDVDGMGAGVVDFGKFQAFQGGAAPMQPKAAKKDRMLKSVHANLKTQCYYAFAEAVEDGLVSFEGCVYMVDGIETDTVRTKKWGSIKIQALIKKQLRAIRKRNPDNDGKKRINDKAQQKVYLGGMSPDIADALAERFFWEVQPKNSKEPFFLMVG